MISILIQNLMEKYMFKQFDLRFIFQLLTFGAVAQRFNGSPQEKKSTATRYFYNITLVGYCVASHNFEYLYITLIYIAQNHSS